MASMSFDFSGKVALVTGASRGIGRAAAVALLEAGATVIEASRSSGVDLRDRKQRERVASNDDIDILVNCAGGQTSHTAVAYPSEAWDGELELNLTATWDLCKRVAPAMIRRGWGRIVNFSSIAGIQGTRNIVGYSVAKAGVIELTKCLSNEWSPHGVTVNCIAPGYVVTEMLKGLIEDGPHAEAIKGRIPIGRFARPAEVVAAVLFFCSDEANYITGTTLPVDGGWLAR